MSKITLNSKNLKEAIAKLNGFIGETIVLELTKQVSEAGTLAKLKACNGVAQAVAMITYGGDAVEEKLIFTNQLSTVVDALSAFGEELAFELLEGKTKVSSGTAVADVSYATECKEIDAPNFQEVPTAVIGLTKEQFQRAVLEGGYINEKVPQLAYSQTCLLQAVVGEGDKPFLKVFSSSGQAYAESVVPVGINPKEIEVFKAFAGNPPVVVKSGPLLTIAKSLKSDIAMYLTQKFVFLVTASEAYSFLPVAAQTGSVDKILNTRFNKDFSAELSKEKVLNAFKVVGLSADSSSNDGMFANVTITEQEGGKVAVLVADINGVNSVTFTGEGTGNKQMALRKSEVIRALDNMSGDKVTIYGNTAHTFIFLNGDNPNAFGFNVTVDLNEVKK